MKVALALVGLALAGMASADQSTRFNAATDLIVTGKVETLKYEPLGDDLVVDGEFTARLTISRVIRGHSPRHVLTIKYIAHAERPANVVGRYYLRSAKGGLWLACGDSRGEGYVCR